MTTLAHEVAEDLRELYGDRLVEVLVFGSRARGDHYAAREASDADARAAIADARVVVDAVEAWLESRQ